MLFWIQPRRFCHYEPIFHYPWIFSNRFCSVHIGMRRKG
ncbi:hypothetical protein M5689_007042 [Euphorbia peplus]|nr:hypothetical protein M5689_007042 [Euphorbia peplus]